MSAEQRRCTLVVLAWNKWRLTAPCLETLLATDLRDAEVLVVDNGSTDETPRRLAAMEGVRVVTLPENVGFVRGNNAGIAAADPASDIVLLNNDLELLQPDWLERLRECAASGDDVGIVGCRLVQPDGALLHAGTFVMTETWWPQHIGSREKDIGQFANRRDVEGIVFACAYLKRELIAVLGGLSTDFESYFEDTDYCLRARQAGYRTLVCGDVTLVHHEHGSTADDEEHFERLFHASRQTFRKKWSRTLEGRYSRELCWQSIMNFPTGYAMSCREYAHTLEALGGRMVYRYVYGPGSPFPLVEPEQIGDYRAGAWSSPGPRTSAVHAAHQPRLNVVRARHFPKKPAVSVVYGQGDVLERNAGRYKIGFTMLEVASRATGCARRGAWRRSGCPASSTARASSTAASSGRSTSSRSASTPTTSTLASPRTPTSPASSCSSPLSSGANAKSRGSSSRP